MTNEEINRLVAERIFNHPVALAPHAWTVDDWLSSDTPTQTNVFAIINPSFKPGSMSPPAYCIPEYATDPEEASILENKIEQDGRAYSYAENLIMVIISGGALDNKDISNRYKRARWLAWGIARATPRQKCLAALLSYGFSIEELS